MGLHSSSPTVLFSLSELDVNKVVDHIDALIKAKRTAVKAQVVIPGVYPFPAGVRLVVSVSYTHLTLPTKLEV